MYHIDYANAGTRYGHSISKMVIWRDSFRACSTFITLNYFKSFHWKMQQHFYFNYGNSIFSSRVLQAKVAHMLYF